MWPGDSQFCSMTLVIIVKPTKYGVRRLVAAFRTMWQHVAALHKLTNRAER